MSRRRITSAQPAQSQSIASATLSLPVASRNVLAPRYGTGDVADTPTVARATKAAQQPLVATRTKSLSVPAAPVQQPASPMAPGTAHDGSTAQPSDSLSYDPSSSTVPLALVPQQLPSLLRYIDHDLMQNVAAHDHPQHPDATCAICILPWDSPVLQLTPAARSTFLPLSPCGHWVHYRCFIYTTTQTDSDGKDKCAACRMPLFQWEGITALTLATRTGFQLEERIRNPADRLVNTSIGPSYFAFEAECDIVDAMIPQYFYAQLTQPSRFTDGSLDLVNVYHEFIKGLAAARRPHSRWLSYHTDIGYLLFCTFAGIKMRRWLLECHGRLAATEGWKAFEESRLTIQGKLWGEVHKE